MAKKKKAARKQPKPQAGAESPAPPSVDYSYSNLAIPVPYRIFGLRLKPLSLGHCLLMQRFDCAFMAETPRPATLADLLLGVFICSKTQEEFLQMLDTADWIEQVKAWGTRCGAVNVPERLELFRNYLGEGMREPAVVFEDASRTSHAHWTHSLKVGLMQLGYSPAEALNMPMTTALADFFKGAENHGVLRILDARTAALLNEEEAA